MIYNGVDLSDYFIASSASNSLMPSVKINTQRVSGKDGEIYLGRHYEPREIKVKMLMNPTCDKEEAFMSLAEVISSESPKELVIEEDSERSYMAVVSGGTDLDSLWRYGGGEIVFYCPDPIAYGCEHEHRFNTSGSFYVGGNYPTRATIEAVPLAGSTWQIVNANTGKFIKVNYPFDGTDYLILDMDAQVCTVNDVIADKYVTLDSDYFQFDPGTVTLNASTSSVIVRWRDRWL